MDDLDQNALDRLTIGQCPTCFKMGFRIGPQGGVAINIECVSCKARFNVVMFGGRCLMAQTIPSEADGGGAWPAGTDVRAHRGTVS